jgi:hypothetical protein
MRKSSVHLCLSDGKHEPLIAGEPQIITHDNGGRPFAIHQKGGKAYISALLGVFDRPGTIYYVYELRKIYSAKRIVGGSDPDAKWAKHTCALIESAGKYIYVGTDVSEFHPSSPMKSLSGKVGNSDVIYSAGIDDDGGVYLFAEMVYCRDPPSSNWYADYYAGSGKWSPIKRKIIIPRI